MNVLDGEPFRAAEAKRRIRLILTSGHVNLEEPHFRQECAKDHIDIMDVINALRAGVVEEGECENGDWRYRVRTGKICVVVAFEGETELVVVTVWSLKS